MNLKQKKKIVLILTVLVELAVGFIFLFNFYQRKIVHKTQDSDKIAVINKENLVFPNESEFKYYYELQSNIEVIDDLDWLPHKVKYIYNADGLNERFDYSIEKPVSTFRIVTLGDSFTYGHYVDTKNNWPEQLEDLLNNNLLSDETEKFEVINLGMAGWDAPYTVKRYKEIGAKYHPDLIIWFESGSSFTRLNELLKPLIDDCVSKCDQNQQKELNEQDRLYYCHKDCWKEAEKTIQDRYSYESFIQLVTKSFDDLFFTFDYQQILFFTFDSKFLDKKWPQTINYWQNRYPNVIFSSTIPYVYDLGKVLADGHPNEEGYQIIAKTIYDYLKVFISNKN